MEKLISEQIVDSILSQDTDAFVGAFNDAIASKVSDALEVKKVEIASNLITPEMAVEEEVEQIDEASYSAKAARAGKDIGKPGKMFAKIAKGAAKRYGSEESGKRVAGAVLAKLRSK